MRLYQRHSPIRSIARSPVRGLRLEPRLYVLYGRRESRASVAGRSPVYPYPFTSPFDPPRAPPFGGSHDGQDCTTSMREKKRRRPPRGYRDGGIGQRRHADFESVATCDTRIQQRVTTMSAQHSFIQLQKCTDRAEITRRLRVYYASPAMPVPNSLTALIDRRVAFEDMYANIDRAIGHSARCIVFELRKPGEHAADGSSS
jgi:hypothetical protein